MISITVDNPEGEQRLLDMLTSLVTVVADLRDQMEELMTTQGHFDAVQQEMLAHLADIAADITEISDQLKEGMTAEEVASAKAQFQGIADQMKTVADMVPEEPVPPAPSAEESGETA